MSIYEVAATITAKKFLEIEASTEEEAIKLAKRGFDGLWPSIGEDFENVKFVVTNIIER